MSARDWQQALLALARQHFEAQVLGRGAPGPRDVAPACPEAAGVFVSLHVDGELRGCLGTLEDAEQLAASVARLAADVAHRDWRFAPVLPAEMVRTTIEISVLTAPEPVGDLSTIVVGRHGLIVEQGRARGLLLPQVAVEHGWDREALLGHTCLKAGLQPDAWRRGAAVFCFEAIVFAETGVHPT